MKWEGKSGFDMSCSIGDNMILKGTRACQTKLQCLVAIWYFELCCTNAFEQRCVQCEIVTIDTCDCVQFFFQIITGVVSNAGVRVCVCAS